MMTTQLDEFIAWESYSAPLKRDFALVIAYDIHDS